MEMTQLLLKYGEEINEDNVYVSFGRSPLQQAVENGDLPMIDLLLEEGANVNQAAANYHGATALQLSAIKRYLGIAKVLIDRGAHVDAKRAAECDEPAEDVGMEVDGNDWFLDWQEDVPAEAKMDIGGDFILNW
ncbi:B-cell lymphoma 3 protein [Colletotrichum orbiculare MAFF 240422]|uniref:B-cell lymphoma 3 protein n=1 Tax=Colletotrichum orbiculare (strain 104-T / ATCC 96160 / CBS 514.97 / LARS 414 / MAFF 240422) TaxID=1213857 RepID=A0A484FJ81_COLOR|nr:B-cell lymphoma 3 protein [Colletotrichum orbiculare MAFF 240422]